MKRIVAFLLCVLLGVLFVGVTLQPIHTALASSISNGSLFPCTVSGLNVTCPGNLTLPTTVLPGGVPVSVAAYNTVGHPVDPTGLVDSTAGIQAAIDAANTAGRGNIYFPAGSYLISGFGLNLSHITFKGMQLLGDGPDRSLLNITGSIGLDFAGSNEMTMRDIGVVGFTAGVGILLGRYTDSLTNGQSRFENIHMSGSYTVAAIYSVAAEGNIWSNPYIQNSIAGRTWYASITNDLSVTTPRGTLATGSGVQTTVLGGLIQNCVDSATTSAIEIHGDISLFNMFGTYIGTQGKGIYRSGTTNVEYAGPVNMIGGGIENCIASGVSANYNPVYIDAAKFYSLNFTSVAFIDSGGVANPDVFQVANGTPGFGYLKASNFLNNISPNGFNFYDLYESNVTGHYAITVRDEAISNVLAGSAVSIAAANTNNDITIMGVGSPSRSISGPISIPAVSTAMLFPSGTVAAPSVGFSSFSGTGMFAATNAITLAINGSAAGAYSSTAGHSAIGYGIINDTFALPHGMNIRETGVYGLSTGAGQVPTAGVSYGGTGIVAIGTGAAGSVAGSVKSQAYLTAANCSSTASPAVCASAVAGSVTIAAAATTVVVNTTAVTANSQIIVLQDAGLQTKLGIGACYSALNTVPWISARTAGTSFTITATAPTVIPACYSYQILN